MCSRADANPDTYTIGYCHGYGNSHTDRHSYRYPNTDCHGDGNSDRNRDGYVYPNADCYGDGNRDGDNPTTYSNTDPDPNSSTDAGYLSKHVNSAQHRHDSYA